LVRLTGGNRRKVSNDSLGLNIWRNLNMLRDTLKGCEQSYLVLLPPAGLS
jgi:hypothetical protein